MTAEFDADLMLSCEPVRRYLVETTIPGTGDYWLRASTPHVTRELAQQTLNTLEASPTNDPQAVRRIGAEVVLRYADADLVGVATRGLLTAKLDQGGGLARIDRIPRYEDDQKRYVLPLVSPEVGPISFEIGEADLAHLLGRLQALRWSLDPTLSDPTLPKENHNG